MIKLANVTKVYASKGEDKVLALDNINLTIQQKGLIVFTGTSGCGKTTMLNLLGGFDSPTEGCVSVFGKDLQTLSEKQLDDFRLNKLGFVFQDFNLIEDFDVEENIRLPLEMRNIESNEMMKMVQEVSEKTNIRELLKKKVSHLSGGQKQRVAIARSIVKNPDIILADEPTGNLDGENSRMVFELLKEIAKDRAVIVVTHDVELAREYADRVVTLSYGKIIDDSEQNLNHSEKTENDSPYNKSAKVPFKLGIRLAGNMLIRRASRSLLTILILSLTIAVFLVIVSIEKRKDAIAVTEYVQSSGAGVALIYEKLSAEGLRNAGQKGSDLTKGSIFWNDVALQLNENDYFLENTIGIEFGDKQIDVKIITTGNERLSKLSGRSEPLKNNEMLLETVLANALGVSEKDLPVKVKVVDMEFEVVGIVNQFRFIGEVPNPIAFFSEPTWKQLVNHYRLQADGLGFAYYKGPLDQSINYESFGNAADNEYSLLAGRKPEKKSEVLISDSLCNAYFDSYESALGKEFRLFNLYDVKYDKAFSDSINLFDFCGENVTIVGVVSGEMDWYITPDVFKALREIYPAFQSSIGIVLEDEKLSENIKSLLENNIYIADSNLKLLYSEWEKTDEKLLALRSVAVVMSLLTVLQMISLLSFSIKDSKKTIGTLRALGATPVCITQIFALEGLVATLTSLILSFVAKQVAIKSINEDTIRKVYQNVRIRTIVPNEWAGLFVAIAVSLVALCVVLIPIAKLNKTKIIDLLK